MRFYMQAEGLERSKNRQVGYTVHVPKPEELAMEEKRKERPYETRLRSVRSKSLVAKATRVQGIY